MVRNGYVILYLRAWFLCRYEVTNKDELLQEIYLEEEKKSSLIISVWVDCMGLALYIL